MTIFVVIYHKEDYNSTLHTFIHIKTVSKKKTRVVVKTVAELNKALKNSANKARLTNPF